MDTKKFTLRFHDARTHEMLGVIAGHLGMSKNELAEQMLERELLAAALGLEADMTGLVTALQEYRAAGPNRVAADIEAFGEAEGYEHDPLRSTFAGEPAYADPLNIAGVFST